ncbi:alpha/beta hydrolase [Olivibacter sp. SDN3]|uniref:serine aminopeptidase domain-containing protein n=1 Tax=Olivibacter sp. SDN3 TaxID=2764720 RepID=UPI00165183FA|nr:alpha/beta hydrolase [Olivibacter sp. SDN3]QNL47751.1 alpha/beta hydrolase [Olivibacter sp. SDN3]
MIRIYTFIILFLAMGRGSAVNAQTANHAATAQSFISNLAAADYEQALDLAAAAFKAKVSAESISKIWQQLNQAYGPYESVSLPDSIDQNASPLTIHTTFRDYVVPLTFHFNSEHEIVGFFVQQSPRVRGDVKKSPANFPEEEIKIKVDGGVISGNLMTPKNPQTGMPIALLIAGSGPTDRDGNNAYGLQANSYLLLAEALADNGIATFRYDKRLIGESVNFETSANKVVFNDFVQDAVTLGQFLKGRKDFGKFYIIGHSEGSNIGMVAAQQLHPDAFVSIAGPGENLAEILETQLLPDPNLAKQAKPIIAKLVKGEFVENVPEELNGLFDPSIQAFIISSFQVEPTEEVSKLNVPVLLIGGTADLQVPTINAELLKEANPNARLLLIKGMNHVLKAVGSGKEANLATYKSPGLPLHSDLVIGLVNFLK